MSARNRRNKAGEVAARRPHEFYPTPPDALAALEPWIPDLYRGGRVVEPAAGDGAVVAWVAQHCEPEDLVAVDIEMTHARRAALIEAGATSTIRGDWMDPELDLRARLLITNPPYSRAQDFIDWSLRRCEVGGAVVMLLRLGFLASLKRRQWWGGVPLARVGVLSRRPRFVNGSSDSADYGWFMWRPRHTGPISLEIL